MVNSSPEQGPRFIAWLYAKITEAVADETKELKKETEDGRFKIHIEHRRVPQ
jgi:hypothetical protein